MIDHEKKFVFLQIPKTASDSVCEALLSLTNKKKMMDELANRSIFAGCFHHATLDQIETKTKTNYNDYFVFTFVRNPFDRVLSEYLYIPKYLKKIENREIRKCCKTLTTYTAESFLYKYPTFSDFVRSMIFINGHETSQHVYTDHSAVDFIGRFESLQQDFDTVCDKINVSRKQLPHNNKSKHRHYTEYYDDEARAIVSQKYAKDIEYFGYKFGDISYS